MPEPPAAAAPWPSRAWSLTFDNLGEAAELELGTWPADRPIGHHPSVTRALPRVLDLLASNRATFFVEAWACDVYPDAIREIAARGHEVALHGYRHEAWRGLAEAEERHLVERSLEAFDRLGLRPLGFRPPGGALTSASRAILREHGFLYTSELGQAARAFGGFASLPFRWTEVDAAWVDPIFAPLRERWGEGPAPLPSARFEGAVSRALESLRAGEHRAVVLHPYLLADPEHRAALSRLLDRASERVDARPAPCREVAARLAGAAAAS